MPHAICSAVRSSGAWTVTRNTLALYNDDELPARGERATQKKRERWVGREERRGGTAKGDGK